MTQRLWLWIQLLGFDDENDRLQHQCHSHAQSPTQSMLYSTRVSLSNQRRGLKKHEMNALVAATYHSCVICQVVGSHIPHQEQSYHQCDDTHSKTNLLLVAHQARIPFEFMGIPSSAATADTKLVSRDSDHLIVLPMFSLVSQLRQHCRYFWITRARAGCYRKRLVGPIASLVHLSALLLRYFPFWPSRSGTRRFRSAWISTSAQFRVPPRLDCFHCLSFPACSYACGRLVPIRDNPVVILNRMGSGQVARHCSPTSPITECNCCCCNK